MQTFLPYPDFDESVRVLDYRRLGKQRVEAMQILQILAGRQRDSSWWNHPAVRMWDFKWITLFYYYNAAVREWIRRGYRNNMPFLPELQEPFGPPVWLGDPEFHSSHRAVLLGKAPDWYSQFGWLELPAVKVAGRWPYKWPVVRAEGIEPS